VFSLVLTLGLSYSLATLVRQRYQREQLIVELQEAHRRLQLSAAQEADLAALRERNRLAREMHDSLGHALVLIAMKIEAAQRLQAIDPERATAEWEDTKALVRATMADLRNSLAGLRLPALEEQPFCDALATLAEEMGRRTKVAVTTTLDPACATLDRPLQEALYRVAQEGLANVAKHARAQQAWLTLAIRGETAELEVADDGVGLGATLRDDSGHYGVLGMRERVEALGGVLTLGPRDGHGTRLRARVPIELSALSYQHSAIG
jgi:signal transduction histidine kinase